MPEKERYFGSVRFFKNMILLAVIVCITVPTVLAVHWHRKAAAVSAEVLSERQKLEAEQDKTAELQAELEKRQAELEAERAGRRAELEAATASDVPDYQLLYPDFYADTPLPAVQAQENVIYLTFDDGPSASTDELLDILEEKNVKATFFVVGKTDAESIARMKRIAAAGHTLGMHSYSHEYKQIYGSVEDFLADFYKLFVLLRDEVGVTPTVFRFPGGSINSYDSGIYQELAAEMLRRGFRYYDWNLSAEDAVTPTPSANKITHNILTSASGRQRGVVLMHDSRACGATVQALPDIIDGLREMGFELAPLERDVKAMTFSYKYYGKE